MDLESELREIWAKYEPQRAAERDAIRTRHEAQQELAELNARRARIGLRHVAEWEPQQGLQGQVYMTGPAPKTWLGELDAAILACVRKHME